MHAERAVPAGTNFPKGKLKVFCPTFCTLQKVGKSGEAAKGFNFVCAKPPLRCADSRFAKPRNFPERERVYSFRLYEKNQKYTRGLRTSGLRGRFKALSEFIWQKPPVARAETGFAHKTPTKRI